MEIVGDFDRDGVVCVRLYHDHVLVKEPGTRQRTPWHQDLHSAGGVAGPEHRRVLSIRFLGDDVVPAPRPWATSPPFPDLVGELPAGAPMDHPRFPVLWPVAS